MHVLGEKRRGDRDMIRIEFETTNSAFDDYGDREIIRVLAVIAEKVERGMDKDIIIDIDGNKIGKWELN